MMVEEVGHRTLHPAKDVCDKLNLALQIEQILNKITFFFFLMVNLQKFPPAVLSLADDKT